jgi:hypothetical protein
MPILQPKPGEEEKDFMDRCIPALIKDGSYPAQAAGICSGIFNRKSKGRKFDAMSSLDNIDFDD